MEFPGEERATTVDMQEERNQVLPSPPRLARLTKRSPPRDVEEVGTLASDRRESFLQERKDRLAQRRLKHSQVLARGRVDVPAKLEALRESLSAAQAARSAIYAKIAANGSKEVARAQFIVQQNKEKLRLERETKQLALQVKLAEAQKRREAALRGRRYGRRSVSPRATSAEDEAMECDPVTAQRSPEIAAVQLQRWWRRFVVTRRARTFSALHLDHETVAEIPFEVIADVIKGKDVIDCAGRLLAIAGLLSANDKAQATCRIFLSTYMLVGHPSAILMHEGPLEDQLVKTAKLFASTFSHWLRVCTLGCMSPNVRLEAAWQQYSSAFQNWRQADSANLLEAMVAQYCELDLIYQIVKMDSDPIVAAEYHTAIKDNQLMLLSRIRGIAGDETRKLIKNAVLAARRKRLPRKQKDSSVKAGQEPQGDMRAVSTADAIQFFSLGERQTRLSNRQLIHELALDPAFQITRPVLSTEAHAREAAMKQNFFTSLQAEIRAQKSSSWVPIVVQECKMRLLRLVMPDSPTFKAITAAFDIPVVEAECRRNSYDFLSFTDTVVQMMRALCSPARDALVSDIGHLRGHDDVDLFAKRIDAIFEVLDTLLLDSANFHLTMSASRLIPESVPYEQKLFRQEVENGSIILTKTATWLKSSSELLERGAQSRDPEQIRTDCGISPLATYQHGIVQVCTSDQAVPETLHLDLQRLETYRGQALRIVTIAAHMTTVKNLMHPKSRHLNLLTWTSMRDRLAILIDDARSIDTEAIAAEINHVLDRAYTGTEVDRAERHVTLQHLIAKNTPAHPVHKLLLRRLQGLLRDAIAGREVTASKMASMGLDEVRQPIELLMAQVKALADLNWSCYQSWYTEILQQSLAQSLA